MTDLTVAPADGSGSYWGTAVSDMQSDISITKGVVSGTLKYLSEGQLVTDWGKGNFIALKFSNFSDGVTYDKVQVGLVPSQGAGMVTLDADTDGVFKITDKAQKLRVVQKGTNGSRTQYISFSGLTLETEA